MDTQLRYDVLVAISDDYEDLQNVMSYVRRFAYGAKTVTDEEVGRTLSELIGDGLAEAYLLSPQPPHALKVDFDPSKIEKLWFYATPKGKDFARNIDELS